MVLMHDVDTERGQQKCLQLMQLDEKTGFRSSFNFVPERYHVSSEVRRILAEKGFEIGVHGLKHDGKLFLSRERFEEQAVRINHYLKDWQSVGFVSPSMHRNLDWIHDLSVEYDVSTFDTDPFEPQPDGVRTIFPFWVSATPNSQAEFGSSELVTRNPEPETVNYVSQPSSSSSNLDPLSFNLSPSTSNLSPPTASANGYVELPYTLPQDHGLFVIMCEKSIDIWKKKLDWIAEYGGMALLITHPDYMGFDGTAMEEYPAECYKEFLQYIKSNYESQYWHVLPKEMARFWAKNYRREVSKWPR